MDGQALLLTARLGVGCALRPPPGAAPGTACTCPCSFRGLSSQDSGHGPQRRQSDTTGGSTELKTHAPLAHQLCPQPDHSSGLQTSVDLSSSEPVVLGQKSEVRGPRRHLCPRCPVVHGLPQDLDPPEEGEGTRQRFPGRLAIGVPELWEGAADGGCGVVLRFLQPRGVSWVRSCLRRGDGRRVDRARGAQPFPLCDVAGVGSAAPICHR